MRSLAMDVASYLYFFITQGPHAAQALVGRLTIEWPLKRKKKKKGIKRNLFKDDSKNEGEAIWFWYLSQVKEAKS